MKANINIAEIFPKHLFWDMDPSRLKVDRDSDVIIPRALYFTTADTFENDIANLEQLYSQSQILEELKATREKISNSVCRLVSKRYHVQEFLRFK